LRYKLVLYVIEIFMAQFRLYMRSDVRDANADVDVEFEYEGEVNAQGLAHGSGSLASTGNVVYCYRGTFVEGLLHGAHCEAFFPGFFYVGAFYKGRATGQGLMTSWAFTAPHTWKIMIKTGLFEDGVFLKGTLDLLGFTSNVVLTADSDSNVKDGEPFFTRNCAEDMIRYIGALEQSRTSGTRIRSILRTAGTYAQGCMLEGSTRTVKVDFFDDHISELIYKGETHLGKRHDKGRSEYKVTDIEGELKALLVYEGYYRDDMEHDEHARFTTSTGTTYEGAVERGLKHGAGRLTLRDGSSVYCATWRDGNLWGSVERTRDGIVTFEHVGER
jgi:hypothetical protein